MQEAKQIFLVTAPDLTAVHLARVKVNFLESLQLSDKVVVLLNRSTRSQVLSKGEIQDLTGAPVLMTLPEDPKTVYESTKASGAVSTKSELGKQIKTLAEMLISRNTGQTQPKRQQRFVEYFSLVPGKYRFEHS
jgi:pilus assembly protein CpaE